MKSGQGSLVYWVVGCVVVLLVACLCLLLAAAGWSLVSIRDSRRSSQPEPDTQVVAPTPFSSSDPLVAAPLPAPAEAEAMRQQLAAVQVPVADPIELAGRLQGVTDIPRVLAETAAPIELGSVDQFWVSDEDSGENFQVTAELVYVTPHVYLWVQRGVDYAERDARALADAFEQQIYPTNRDFFGSEWTPGIDGDPHIYILFARGLGSWVAGYYGSMDEYSPLVHEYSNGREMFYISADGQSLRDEYTYGVLAHEFQHMIHWNLDANEDNWLDEGLADVATFLNGFDVGGWDFAFAEDPDIPLTFWPSGSDSSIHYGQAFLFSAYFMDRFGSEATQSLVSHTANGLDSMDQVLAELGITETDSGRTSTADDAFRDWAVAQLLLDPTVGDGRYSIESYPSAPRLVPTEDFADCPVAATPFTVNQYGIDVLRISCRGEYRLRFQGQTMIRVLPQDPPTGSWAFWSNRGNVSNMRLTRAFDLRSADAPIELSYRLWYDIEEDWDYVYLEASTDGGTSWEILRTPSGTGTDPSGNSYGWGYTGTSGGETAAWIEEQVDLSNYAGQEILLRFEYVTDASVNGNGLLLDDVALPAIGYEESFESGEAGWQAEGFVRLYNRLPQSYRLMLVERGAETRVQELRLNEYNQAEVPLQLGGTYDEAFLVVTGTARASWEPAPYQVEIIP